MSNSDDPFVRMSAGAVHASHIHSVTIREARENTPWGVVIQHSKSSWLCLDCDDKAAAERLCHDIIEDWRHALRVVRAD